MRRPDRDIEAAITSAYDAFNQRDIDGAVALMTDDVAWANGWEGGHVHGHDNVRDYWDRQWNQIDPRVTPIAMTVDDQGRIHVEVDQEVRDPSGTLLAANRVRHVYTMRDGLVCRFDIETSS